MLYGGPEFTDKSSNDYKDISVHSTAYAYQPREITNSKMQTFSTTCTNRDHSS